MNQDEELKQMFDLPAKQEPQEIVPKEAPKGSVELETDFEYTRDNMYTAMEMQNEAMQEMLELYPSFRPSGPLPERCRSTCLISPSVPAFASGKK